VQRSSVHEMVGTTLPTDLPAPTGSQEAVERTVELLGGRGLDSHRVLVSLNAGYLLARTGVAVSLREGIELADDVLRSGVVLDSLPRNGLGSRRA